MTDKRTKAELIKEIERVTSVWGDSVELNTQQGGKIVGLQEELKILKERTETTNLKI